MLPVKVIGGTFGRDDIVWNYFSNIVVIPAGTNQVKMIFRGEGTITPAVNFQGSYVSGFVEISSSDTWIAVPAGTQLVVKVTGSIAARLYNYMLLYKTSNLSQGRLLYRDSNFCLSHDSPPSITIFHTMLLVKRKYQRFL